MSEKYNIPESNSLDSMEGVNYNDIKVETILEKKELSKEQLEIVMTKIDDINKYGTAFTWIGSQEGDLGIGEENSKFRKILKEGVIGVSPDRPNIDRSSWGVPNSVEGYVEDLKMKRQRPPEVFFNIVGRWGTTKANGGGSAESRTIERIPIHRASLNPIIIIFSVDNLIENNVIEKSGKDGQDLPTKKGTFTVHNFGRNKSINTPNENGDVNADTDYGFKLAGRIQPRMFNGIVFRKAREVEEKDAESFGIKLVREKITISPSDSYYDEHYMDDKGQKWKYDEFAGKKVFSMVENDPERLEKYAQKIANDLLLVNEGVDKNLVPIYDDKGNLWWPKQISHEEIVKMKENSEQK